MAFEKLSQLGPRLFGEKPSDLEQALKSTEQVLPMSESYRELLLSFGGAVIFENGAKFKCDEPSPLNDKDGYQSLEVLFGLGKAENSLEREVAQYAGELPASFIPIGGAPGGNLICVDGDGAVHLWDHESLRDGETWRIAASIDEFLKRLEPDDSSTSSLDGIIESESFLDF